MAKIRVSVPATSANLGPAYNSTALALGLHNIVELSNAEQGILLKTQQEEELARLALKAAIGVFQAVGQAPSGLQVRLTQQIPLWAGLGCEESILLGGAVAANLLVGSLLSKEEVVATAVRAGGHAPSLLAALHGGLIISSQEAEELTYRSVPIKPLHVVIALPHVGGKFTQLALPEVVSLKEVGVNIGRSLLAVRAFQDGDYELIAEAVQDRLYQKTRSTLIRNYDQAVQAARQEGAAAVILSGSGPALIAFAPRNHHEIAAAMQRALQKGAKQPVQTWVLPLDTQGISISEMDISLKHGRGKPNGGGSEAHTKNGNGQHQPAPAKPKDKAGHRSSGKKTQKSRA